MLEKQNWMKYAPDIMTEWRQMKEEGREVEIFREECEKLVRISESTNCEEAAKDMCKRMQQASMQNGYSYMEPSSFEEIKEILIRNMVQKKQYRNEVIKDKISGAWIGRISGCLLGKPMECLKTEAILEVLKNTGNYPMMRYADSREFPEGLAEKLDYYSYAPWRKCWIDRINGKAPVDDDTNYTVLALKLIEEYGKDFKPNDVLEAWLYWMPMFSACTAERVAYRNAAKGLYAPETATCENPYREWIGAQIRGDFFGYINPGNPQKAAEMAWRDGSISHVKNGIYGEMFVAAMLAWAAVCDDIVEVIETGLSVIPPKSRLTEGIDKILQWYRAGVGEQETYSLIHTAYDEYDQHDWCHTIPNAMIVTASLLYGKKDFGKTISLAVQTGFDTDCNAATAGSILGMMLGEEKIPPYWSEAYNRTLKTSIAGYEEVTIDQLTEKTIKLMEEEK